MKMAAVRSSEMSKNFYRIILSYTQAANTPLSERFTALDYQNLTMLDYTARYRKVTR
jgi:hypothetical protein